MELIELYRKIMQAFDSRVQAVSDEQWAHTTRCCPDWTVRDLVNHVVSENRWIDPLLSGKTIADMGTSLEGDLLGDDPQRSWRAASTEAIAAIERPGALDGTVVLSSGQSAASSYVAEVLSDQIVHTWDLATSIDADDRLDRELVAFARRTLEPLAEEWRAAGVLGEPLDVPAGATEQTQLLALLGRRA